MKTPIYLDNNATTPVDPRVVDAMLPVLQTHHGNPASQTHSFGWYADELVTIAREQVAMLLSCETDEVIFTSGATESNNIVLRGTTQRYKQLHSDKTTVHIVSAPTEHPSVTETISDLSGKGVAAEYLTVDANGLINPDDLQRSIDEHTILVSIMLANNEIGVVQDIRKLAAIAHEHKAAFHCDATQGVGKLSIDVRELDVDFLSLSAHKFYGPKGIGALFVKRGQKNSIAPSITGGGQEGGIRPGTLNVAGIVGLGKACELAQRELERDRTHLKALSDRLYHGLTTQLSGIHLNGPAENRLAGNLNLSFDDLDGSALIATINSRIAVSGSSACSSEGFFQHSHVLQALGLPDDLLRSSVRFGIGRFNTEAEIDEAIQVVVAAVNDLRGKKGAERCNSDSP